MGEIPNERQGARNDYVALYELIAEGCSNYEILEEKPEFIAQLERMDRVRQTIQEEAYKDTFRELEVSYYFGDTGTGKTREVMEKYGYSNVFRVTNYKNAFDLYKGQDVIVFEEFHSSFPITQMLIFLDGYPLALPCRYSDKIACYTKVYILSNVDLRKQYINVQEESYKTWEAFLRRIHRVKIFEDGEITEYSLEDYMNGFHKLSDKEEKEIPFQEE